MSVISNLLITKSHFIILFYNFQTFEAFKVNQLGEHKTFKPGKPDDQFRNYHDSNRQNTVEKHYLAMRQNQTVGFVEKMEKKWLNFNFDKLTVREAFRKLEGYVDSSDPDSSFPNLEHMLQTAESIREAGHPDWFQLVGLIHDMVNIY